MSKKILVLTGSARKGGNSNRMAQAFAEAAAAKGNEVKVIDMLQDRQALLLRRRFQHHCRRHPRRRRPRVLLSGLLVFRSVADQGCDR